MHTRRRMRLLPSAYVGNAWSFVTICTFNRACFFSSTGLANWLVKFTRRIASEEGFRLHAWCVMPDHLHLLVEGTSQKSDLRLFVRSLKRQSSEKFESRFHRPLWQRNFYDHILRARESGDPIAWYIWMNPVRKGLCADPREYVFSGSETFDWKSRRRLRETWAPPCKTARPN